MSRVIQLEWIAGAGELVILKTRDLIHEFDVGGNQIISLLEFDASNTTTSTLIEVDIDPRLKGNASAEANAVRATQSDIEDSGIKGRFRITSSDGDLLFVKRLYGLPLRDELHLFCTTAATYILDITYDLIPGSMYLFDDLALNIGDITQVQPDYSPGQEWFQPGPVSQIGGTETPPEA